MNLLNFTILHSDEVSCKTKWKKCRNKQGIVYPPHCENRKYYWGKNKDKYVRKHCGYRKNLKANTMTHGGQLPFRYWFLKIYLLASTKKSPPASKLQQQLSHSTYNPMWAMLHKLRQVMSMCDSLYQLSEVVAKDKPLTQRHGSQMSKLSSWVHIIITNAKRMLPDIFHDIKLEYLYLRSYLKRRFDRLQVVAVTYKI
jgi:hypothetical protein